MLKAADRRAFPETALNEPTLDRRPETKASGHTKGGRRVSLGGGGASARTSLRRLISARSIQKHAELHVYITRDCTLSAVISTAGTKCLSVCLQSADRVRDAVTG